MYAGDFATYIGSFSDLFLLRIMSATCDENDARFFNDIHETVFVIDAAAPQSAEISLERLRLPDAVKWTTENILNKLVDAFDHPPIVLLPVEIILPSVNIPMYMCS